ncbi:MAG TPA: type II toxin-antitoxin system RelE/ParE family toxin [Ignavibacteria bacterium]|nr:type II toxin-antitoxin system RelE/ParE family toxin [Ignavibacteria bacterium]
MSKNKYTIKFLKSAAHDLDEILEYVFANNPSAAITIAEKIEKNLELLSENPLMGKIPQDQNIQNFNYRYLIVDNYLIFYSVEPKEIYIQRIFHGARNYKDILN